MAQTWQVFVSKLFPSSALFFLPAHECVGACTGCVGAATEGERLATGERFKGFFIEIDLSGLLGRSWLPRIVTDMCLPDLIHKPLGFLYAFVCLYVWRKMAVASPLTCLAFNCPISQWTLQTVSS